MVSIKNIVQKILPHKEYIMLISGGWARACYALGVFKRLEELGVDKKIKAIYGISAGAIVSAFWSAGFSADETFEFFTQVKSVSFKNMNLFPKKSLLKSDFLRKFFNQHLPKNISTLSRTMYIWASNIHTAEIEFFKTWDLSNILLASSAIPGIFPPVKVGTDYFVDGGVVNNFPAELVKKKFPKNKLIGIALNKFKWKQEIKSIFDVLGITSQIFLRKCEIDNMPFVDYLFYPDLSISVLSSDKKKMKKAFDLWYEDCVKIVER